MPNPPPNTRGWRAPWRGTWGPFNDGRSRISRLARKLERELLEEHGPWISPAQARRAKMAARFQALAEQVAATLGTNSRATPRTLARLQREADVQLAACLAMNGQRKPLDLAQELAAAFRRREANP